MIAPTTTKLESPAATAAAADRLHRNLPWTKGEETNGVAVFTSVVWLVFLTIGALGFKLRYERPHPKAPLEPPILVQQLQVELTQELLPPPDAEPLPPDPLAPPPPPDALTPPAIIQPVAVAQPSPAIAFLLPVEGATRVVDFNRAEYSRPVVTNATTPIAAPPPAQSLVFGEGEGRQPAPDYPPAARRQGQEGTVLVRFTVGESGRVLSADAVLPSPWPLLNEAAVRAVRERWRFRNGPTRTYEVAIRFEIVK
jgi:TonB family protein